MKVKLFIVMLLIGLVALPSCSDNYQDEIDTEQIALIEVIGNTYYCEEQNSTIEFISYDKYVDTPYGKEYLVNCVMYGDIVIKEAGEERVNLSLNVKNNIISNFTPGQYGTTIEFKIINNNLLIGSLKVKGNWLKK